MIVANRLINQGKTESDLVGNFIGYIIAKNTDEEDTGDKISFEKASHGFDEVMQSRGKLVPNIQWYIIN